MGQYGDQYLLPREVLEQIEIASVFQPLIRGSRSDQTVLNLLPMTIENIRVAFAVAPHD